MIRFFWGRYTAWVIIMMIFVALLNWDYMERAWMRLMG